MTELQTYILRGFNALENPEQQHQILDVIYDALYHQSYLQVIGNRVVMEKDRRIHELEQEVDYLRDSVRQLDSAVVHRRSAKTYYDSLSKEERKEFRSEVKEEVFYRELRRELEDCRKDNRSLRKRLDELMSRLLAPPGDTDSSMA